MTITAIYAALLGLLFLAVGQRRADAQRNPREPRRRR